jgi:septal ring factor EnvC (AmiA/AmiB activator)
MSTSTNLSQEIQAAATELREAIASIRRLAKASETRGARWDAANREQEAAARKFHKLLAATGAVALAGLRRHKASEE